MVLKMSLKEKEKVSSIFKPQLDALLEVLNDLSSSIEEEELTPQKNKLRASSRKLQKCVDKLRKSFTPEITEKKKLDGQKKKVFMEKWAEARKKVNGEIPDNIVRKMTKGSLYYKLVRAKFLSMDQPLQDITNVGNQ